jgi:hypothetical protein
LWIGLVVGVLFGFVSKEEVCVVVFRNLAGLVPTASCAVLGEKLSWLFFQDSPPKNEIKIAGRFHLLCCGKNCQS